MHSAKTSFRTAFFHASRHFSTWRKVCQKPCCVFEHFLEPACRRAPSFDPLGDGQAAKAAFSALGDLTASQIQVIDMIVNLTARDDRPRVARRESIHRRQRPGPQRGVSGGTVCRRDANRQTDPGDIRRVGSQEPARGQSGRKAAVRGAAAVAQAPAGNGRSCSVREPSAGGVW